MIDTGIPRYRTAVFPNNTLPIGDYNIYLFINDAAPVTLNICWRVTRSTTLLPLVQSFSGLDPRRNSADVLITTTPPDRPLQFSLLSFSVKGETYLEYVKRETGQVVGAKINITETGISTHTFPNLTGSYILRYTIDGESQNISYVRLLGGMLYFGLPDGWPSSARIGVIESRGIVNWTNSSDVTQGGNVNAQITVLGEDFDYPVEFSIVNKTTGAVVGSAHKSFEDGKINEPTVKDITDNKYSSMFLTYDINYSLGGTVFGDGMYVGRAKRNKEEFDIFQFEVFKGRAFDMAPGETPILPLSADNPDWNNDYNRIFILGEAFVSTSSSITHYSVDGGKKWQPISEMSKLREVDTKTGRLNSAKVFDRGFELWLSDTAPSGKRMSDSANLIKFPKVGKRPGAPRLEVNYQLAHMVDGVLDFDVWDENLWVPVERGKTELLNDRAYFYVNEGVKENSHGDERPSGKPNWAGGIFPMFNSGMPIPESCCCNGGIREIESERSERIVYRSIRQSYFVFRAPQVSGSVFFPASKPARLGVSSYLKPPSMRINYKSETMKLRAGIVFEDKRIFDGVVDAATARDKTKNIINVTELLNEGFEASYQVAPTAKRPASGPVEWYPAERGEEFTDEFSNREQNVIVNGKFRPSRVVEFRQKTSSGWPEKWGSFRAPKTGTEEYEFRAKATARGGRLMFDGDMWIIDDSIAFKRIEGEMDEIEVWAAGKAHTFEYRWGTNYHTTNGKTPTKPGIEWTILE
jgi:hypothetical protein